MGLLILLCVWTYWNLNNYIKTVGNIRQANLTIRTNTQVLSLIKDAETGHRGYQLTHDEEYLKPYYQARIQLPEELERLDSLSAFIPSIKVPVKQLEGLIDIQLNTIEQILRSTKWKNSFLETEEVRLLQEGKNNMDLIRNVGDLINQTARRIASTAIEDEGGFKTLTPVNLLVVALIAFGGVLLLFTRAVMLLEDRDKKSQNLEKAVQDLQEETQKRIHTSNLLRSVLDNSKEGIMALTAVRNDAGEIVDFDFVLVNEASAKMAQRSQSQMIEKKLSEKFKEVAKDFVKNKNYGLRDHDMGAHDFLDLASDSYYTEFALLLSDSDREMLRQIEEAVAKIKDGRYGNCNECKSEISDKRLEAVPWARYCIKCQELEEKGLL